MRRALWLMAAAWAACLEPTQDLEELTAAGSQGGQGGASDAGPVGGYSYPGCANEDYGCPRLKTVYCALETIRQKYDACQVDGDCGAASVAHQCTGYGVCNPKPAVNLNGRSAFEAEAAQELTRYCASNGQCFEMAACAPGSYVAVCRSGRCTMESNDVPGGGPASVDAG